MQQSTCLTCPWRERGPFRHLSDDQASRLSERLSRFTVNGSGATIFSQDQPSSGVYLVCSGRLKLTSLTEEGHQVILDVVNPCSAVGEGHCRDGSLREVYSAVALDETVEVAHLDSTYFRDREADPSVLSALLEDGQGRLRRAFEHVELLRLPVEKRVCRLLQALAEVSGEEGDDEMTLIPLSSAELAQYAQTTSETVSRVLASFRADGSVRVSRGQVFVSPERLRSHDRRSTRSGGGGSS